MIPSFLRWAVLVFSLAGGFFLIVWQLLVDEPPGREETSPPAAVHPAAGQAFAAPTAPASAAPPPEPLAAWPLFAFDRAYNLAKGEAEPASGDGCIDMGPENRRNRSLVDCLQPDRRVAVRLLPGG